MDLVFGCLLIKSDFHAFKVLPTLVQLRKPLYLGIPQLHRPFNLPKPFFHLFPSTFTLNDILLELLGALIGPAEFLRPDCLLGMGREKGGGVRVAGEVGVGVLGVEMLQGAL